MPVDKSLVEWIKKEVAGAKTPQALMEKTQILLQHLVDREGKYLDDASAVKLAMMPPKELKEHFQAATGLPFDEMKASLPGKGSPTAVPAKTRDGYAPYAGTDGLKLVDAGLAAESARKTEAFNARAEANTAHKQQEVLTVTFDKHQPAFDELFSKLDANRLSALERRAEEAVLPSRNFKELHKLFDSITSKKSDGGKEITARELEALAAKAAKEGIYLSYHKPDVVGATDRLEIGTRYVEGEGTYTDNREVSFAADVAKTRTYSAVKLPTDDTTAKGRSK